MTLKIGRNQLLSCITFLQSLIGETDINIYAKDNLLSVSFFDKVVLGKYILNCKTQDIIEAVIPGRVFCEIIKGLPNEEITISLQESYLILFCSKIVYKILTKSINQFPSLSFKKDNMIEVDQTVLKQTIKKALISVSDDASKLVLNGIFFEITDIGLIAVSTDGRRLTYTEINKKIEIKDKFSFILPTRIAYSIKNILEDEGIRIYLDGKKIIFESDDFLIISPAISGKYIDYTKVIPSLNTIDIKVNKNKFIKAIKQITALTSIHYSYLQLKLSTHLLQVKVDIEGVGNVCSDIETVYTGDGINIYLNPKFLLDILNTYDFNEVNLLFNISDKPMLIKGGKDRYVIMPIMRL